MESLLTQIGIIVGVAAIIALLGRVIKQPSIVAYLLTGVVVGPLIFNLVDPATHLQSLAGVGIALLLFIIGTSLDFRILKSVGGASIIGGISTVAIVCSASFIRSEEHT